MWTACPQSEPTQMASPDPVALCGGVFFLTAYQGVRFGNRGSGTGHLACPCPCLMPADQAAVWSSILASGAFLATEAIPFSQALALS